MLEGTLRRGSGMIGSGGAAGVVPVIAGPRCISEAESCVLLRPFGAGFGTGTGCCGTCAVCADNGTASAITDAAIKSRATTEAPHDADDSVNRISGFLCNASSCLDSSYFILVWRWEIWPFREIRA